MFCHRHHYFHWKFAFIVLWFFILFFYLRTTYVSSEPEKKGEVVKRRLFLQMRQRWAIPAVICVPPNRYAEGAVTSSTGILKVQHGAGFAIQTQSLPAAQKRTGRRETDRKKLKTKNIYLWNMRRIARTLFFLALGCLLCEAGKWKEKYPIRKRREGFVEYLNFWDIVV